MDRKLTEELIDAAAGKRQCDIVIRNAKVVDVCNKEIFNADVYILSGMIVGFDGNRSAKEEYDAKGRYLLPGLIDAHCHIESSHLSPSEFSDAVIPCGTTTVIADPHEICNVTGLDGMAYMLKASENIPLSVFLMFPSCVPATPFETSGFDLNSYDLSLLIDKPWVLGIAEMMNFPGVLNHDKNVMAKLKLAMSKDKRIDGHAPCLSDKDLCAYIAAGVTSDHECTTPDEAIEKLRKGMYLMIREGSAAKDLKALLPVLLEKNTRKCIFVTDDRHPEDLLEHINSMVRTAVEAGVPPIKAIQMASLNTAEYFKIQNLGAIAPGYKADFIVLPDLKTFKPDLVFKKGKLVAEAGKLTADITQNEIPAVRGSVNVKWIKYEDFKIEAKSDIVKAIEVIPHQLITKSVKSKINVVDGFAESNLDTDTLKICVIERHRAGGNIGKGFVKGFNLKSGAMASTVAHDSHNMIVIGTNDSDMYTAAVELIKSQGGKIVVNNGEVLAHLPLPVAGLISDADFNTVIEKSMQLNNAAKEIGCKIDDPFMAMGFLSLPVIPELKITDKGVFDTTKFDFVDIFEQHVAAV